MTSFSSAFNRPTQGIFAVLGLNVPAFFPGLADGMPPAVSWLEMRSHLGTGPVRLGWVIGLQSLAALLIPHQARSVGLPLAAALGCAAATLATLCPLPSFRFDRTA